MQRTYFHDQWIILLGMCGSSTVLTTVVGTFEQWMVTPTAEAVARACRSAHEGRNIVECDSFLLPLTTNSIGSACVTNVVLLHSSVEVCLQAHCN